MDNKLCADCHSPSEHVIENVSPSLQALKESFSAYQQMQNGIVASACALQSRMESMLQQHPACKSNCFATYPTPESVIATNCAGTPMLSGEL